MLGSDGAALAALAGRGNRMAVEDTDYEIVLPTLLTGRVVHNTLFLHSDVRERPYRVEDFRDALAAAGVLPDVVALGAYQINHVWAVTLNTGEAAKKLAAVKELKIKGRRCIVFDPEDQQVKLRLHCDASWRPRRTHPDRIRRVRERHRGDARALARPRHARKGSELLVSWLLWSCLDGRCSASVATARATSVETAKFPGVEEGKRAGPVDASAAPGGEATKGERPVEQQAADEASGSKDSLPGAHALPASSVGACRKPGVPGHQRTVGDSAASVDTTVKVMEDRPASVPMAVESQGPTELQPDKGVALTSAGVTVASKRPHPPSCDDGAQVKVPETEEPPADSPRTAFIPSTSAERCGR
ncbi:hypothetical protein HPB50_013598 [Hyalomma asiaticum]|uniref:Uncharacterized protein n=1 Tax=Hyalomma asiaticum TaxID=266040 RepID=A0ACB7RJB6_HYAAI|nr:hypothetical protein HPB50_013598 [Hyalomma asiaticum]